MGRGAGDRGEAGGPLHMAIPSVAALLPGYDQHPGGGPPGLHSLSRAETCFDALKGLRILRDL